MEEEEMSKQKATCEAQSTGTYPEDTNDGKV